MHEHDLIEFITHDFGRTGHRFRKMLQNLRRDTEASGRGFLLNEFADIPVR